jgi:hypothetical protein
MIDRLYPPQGQSLKFPSRSTSRRTSADGSRGKFVTRVIYVEDPNLAIPIAEKTPSQTRWMEVRAGGDPLITADGLGRPIAILRMGGRVPEPNQTDDAFLYCSPPMMVYDRRSAAAAQPMNSVILAPRNASNHSLNCI